MSRRPCRRESAATRDRDGRETRRPPPRAPASARRTAPPAATTATVAFRASSTSVAAARSFRPVRSTLVAPMLPEPIARRSPAPASRVRMQAERDRAEQIAEHQAQGRAVRNPDHRDQSSGARHAAEAYSCATRPATSVSLTLPSSLRLVEGRVAAARMQRRRVEHVGLLGIEADEVGRRADREPAGRKPEDFGRAQRHRAQQARQRDMARGDQAQARRQHRLERRSRRPRPRRTAAAWSRRPADRGRRR